MNTYDLLVTSSTRLAIPFNRPGVVGNEFRYMAEALAQGHISGDGVFTRKSVEPCQIVQPG